MLRETEIGTFCVFCRIFSYNKKQIQFVLTGENSAWPSVNIRWLTLGSPGWVPKDPLPLLTTFGPRTKKQPGSSLTRDGVLGVQRIFLWAEGAHGCEKSNMEIREVLS